MYIDFEYANKRLSDFDCITCCIGESSSVTEIDIGCDITFNAVKNKHTSTHYKTSTSYENVFSTTFEIMKNPCGKNQKDIYMKTTEVRALTKWLNRREYRKFKPICSNGELSDICYYGSFNVKEKTINDNIVGLVLIFTSNSPYGFGEEIHYSASISSENNVIHMFGDSDEADYTIYPKVKIKCLSDGDLKIVNNTTNNVVLVKNCKSNENITIDGEHKIILTDNENHTTLPSDFSYTYFDIQVDEFFSKNEYEFSIPCELEVSYYPIRKVGLI